MSALSPPTARRPLSNAIFTAARRRAPELTAALAGLSWFLAIGGYRALPPTSLDWLGGGDSAQHVMGWLFFRRSRWAFPLGRIDGFVWPSGTTVGFTDSNPLFALAGKLLSPLLPLDFQYVGLWLAACFALQGWFGARLTGLASTRPVDRALGGTLFALAPPLLERLGHDTLCAHFGLLAMILLYLQPAEHPAAARRALAAAAGLVALLAAVHPYLSVMALVLSFSLVAKLTLTDRLLRPGAAWRWAIALLLAQVAVLAVLGFLTSAPSHGGGFGLFSTDLLAFANPMGKSWIVPRLPSQVGQWEGNAYLGLGGLALAVTAIALVMRRGPRGTRLTIPLPLAIACALLFAFALSDVVRVAGHQALDLRALYRPLKGVVGPLRSSGRFVWPFYYLVLTALISAPLLLLRERPRLATAALASGVLLQLVDLAPNAWASQFAQRAWRSSDPSWRLASGAYDHLALVPPQVVGVWGPCRGMVYGDDSYWAPLAYQAYALGMTVNSGYVARGPHERIGRPCEELDREIEAGVLRERTLYVVHASKLAAFQRAGARCGRLDGFDVCVRPEDRGPFAATLAPAAR